MPFFEAVRLALIQIRVQKLKSFFTLLGVTIGVMFLIAVVSIVEGMGKYMREDFAGKLLGVNTFTLRSRAEFSDEQQDDRAIRAGADPRSGLHRCESARTPPPASGRRTARKKDSRRDDRSCCGSAPRRPRRT